MIIIPTILITTITTMVPLPTTVHGILIATGIFITTRIVQGQCL